MPSRSTSSQRRVIRRAAFPCALVVLLTTAGGASEASAQNPVQPSRGFFPAGSYAVSRVESTNTTNGNIIFSVPMASLPAGRGGSPGASVGLFYNSKVWESYTYQDWYGDEAVPMTALRMSDAGGWRYGFRYDLQLVRREDEDRRDFEFCADIPEQNYVYKLKMKFPDGSEHIFRPLGASDILGDEFFNVRPDGWLSHCSGDMPYLTGPMTYYTADGSFMRLTIEHDTDSVWSNNPWTLSLPNGARVTGGNASQRIYDRNNNYFEIQNIEYNNHPATKIVDQLDRYIIVEYGPPVGPPPEIGRDYVHSWRMENGQLTQLTWTIKRREVSVQKGYYGNNLGPSMPMLTAWSLYGISEIVLPAQTGGLSYTFGYSSDQPTRGWGEVNSMTMPSGAQVKYQFAFDGYDAPTTYITSTQILQMNTPYRKELTYNLEYDGSSSVATEETTMGFSTQQSTNVGPDGGVTTEYFYDTYMGTWDRGLVYKTVNPDGSVVERIWDKNIPHGYGTSPPPRANPYVKTEFTSVKNAAGALTKTAIKNFNYDKNGNLIEQLEYDWVNYGDVPRDAGGKPTGVPGSAQLKRVTSNGYYNSTPAAGSGDYDPDIYNQPTSPALRTVMESSEVRSGLAESSALSRTELIYDNPSTTGNLTEQRSWDSTKGALARPLNSGTYISATNQYDVYGNPTLSTNAGGSMTQLVYGNVGGSVDLYPTQIKAAYTTSVQRTETREYDFHSGLVTRVTDVDNNVSTATTYDVFGRTTLVKAAENKAEETRTATEYSDILRRVIVRSDLDIAGDGKLVSIEHYDQLGRVRLARRLEDSSTQSATDETTGIKVQTRYFVNVAHTYSLTSNPYQAATSGAATGEATMGWIRTEIDDVDRVIEVQTFTGATLPSPWGSNPASTGTVTTTYDANQTTVTDQALKKRRSVTDGLGRLERVDEPDKDTGNLDDANGAPIQSTSYGYDALGNLVNVYQGTQTRGFVYSSLSRLVSAMNPESGTICYGQVVSNQCQADGYDANGNLLFKTDARLVRTTFAYDALNRVINRSYQDDPTNTPAVSYIYDAATNGKGRLTSVSSSVSTYSYSGYDALGRVTGATQTIGSQSYTITDVAYDLAGHLKTMKYPSGRTITNTYDNAGRLSSFSGNLGDGTQRTYSTGILYSALGGRAKEQFGTNTPLFNKSFYNSRGQLAEIRVGTTYTGPTDSGWQRGAIINHYSNNCWGMCAGQSMTDNNGNVRTQQHWIPTAFDGNGDVSGWSMFEQQYDYDSLNRLQRVADNLTTPSWQQKYVYDRWGNRTIAQGSNETFGTGIPKPNFGVDTNTNRLTAPAGYTMGYDAAGNLTNDTYTGEGTRTYDAENKMKQAWSNSQWQTYSYDGDGRRIKRIVNGTETWQVYGLGGELIAEYAANTAASSPQEEYGYRNGELLITATVTTGSGGSAFSFTDDPVVVETTTVKAVHVTELRTAVNQARARANLSPATWTDDPVQATVTAIKAVHITELRARLDEARAALGLSAANYTDPALISGHQIKAAHVQELRTKTNEALTTGGGTSLDLRWLVSDQLGTPRMIFDQSGSLANMSRHDYLPFGEELFAGVGGRTTGLGYTASDNVRQKFTSKERDNETGLDYFLARYYSSTQGRFTTPDEFAGGPKEIFILGTGDPEKQALPYAEITNPQSLNKYTYAYNSPLRFIDPDGHQGEESWASRLLRSLMRQLDPQQDAEQPSKGPLSMDADKITSQYVAEVANQTLQTAETLNKLGLDFNVLDMAKAMDKNDAKGTAVAAAFMALDIVTLGRKGPLEKMAGEQLSKRFVVTKGDDIAGAVKMADWLAAAKDGSRGIAMEVFTGTNKSISKVRKQLENGMAYLNSQGIRNVAPYVMVNSEKAAARVRRELGRVRGWEVKVIVGP